MFLSVFTILSFIEVVIKIFCNLTFFNFLRLLITLNLLLSLKKNFFFKTSFLKTLTLRPLFLSSIKFLPLVKKNFMIRT